MCWVWSFSSEIRTSRLVRCSRCSLSCRCRRLMFSCNSRFWVLAAAQCWRRWSCSAAKVSRPWCRSLSSSVKASIRFLHSACWRSASVPSAASRSMLLCRLASMFFRRLASRSSPWTISAVRARSTWRVFRASRRSCRRVSLCLRSSSKALLSSLRRVLSASLWRRCSACGGDALVEGLAALGQAGAFAVELR